MKTLKTFFNTVLLLLCILGVGAQATDLATKDLGIFYNGATPAQYNRFMYKGSCYFLCFYYKPTANVILGNLTAGTSVVSTFSVASRGRTAVLFDTTDDRMYTVLAEAGAGPARMAWIDLTNGLSHDKSDYDLLHAGAYEKGAALCQADDVNRTIFMAGIYLGGLWSYVPGTDTFSYVGRLNTGAVGSSYRAPEMICVKYPWVYVYFHDYGTQADYYAAYNVTTNITYDFPTFNGLTTYEVYKYTDGNVYFSFTPAISGKNYASLSGSTATLCDSPYPATPIHNDDYNYMSDETVAEWTSILPDYPWNPTGLTPAQNLDPAATTSTATVMYKRPGVSDYIPLVMTVDILPLSPLQLLPTSDGWLGMAESYGVWATGSMTQKDNRLLLGGPQNSTKMLVHSDYYDRDIGDAYVNDMNVYDRSQPWNWGTNPMIYNLTGAYQESSMIIADTPPIFYISSNPDREGAAGNPAKLITWSYVTKDTAQTYTYDYDHTSFTSLLSKPGHDYIYIPTKRTGYNAKIVVYQKSTNTKVNEWEPLAVSDLGVLCWLPDGSFMGCIKDESSGYTGNLIYKLASDGSLLWQVPCSGNALLGFVSYATASFSLGPDGWPWVMRFPVGGGINQLCRINPGTGGFEVMVPHVLGENGIGTRFAWIGNACLIWQGSSNYHVMSASYVFPSAHGQVGGVTGNPGGITNAGAVNGINR